jgi:hypothetical protein
MLSKANPGWQTRVSVMPQLPTRWMWVLSAGAIGLRVKQEFAAKEKTRLTKKPPTKAVAKTQLNPRRTRRPQ